MFMTALKTLFVLLAVLLVASLLTRKTFHVERVIAATPDEIWNVLADTERYPQWNPVFVEVNGTYVEGGTVLSKVKDPSGNILEIKAIVCLQRYPAHTTRQARQPGRLAWWARYFGPLIQ